MTVLRKTDRADRRALALLTALLVLPLASVAQDASLPVATVVSVEMGEVRARVPIAGTLVPREEVVVVPQVSGYPIVSLEHDAGDRVIAGDVMARLDDRTLAAQLAQADAELARARAAVGQAGSQIDTAAASAEVAATARARTQQLRDGGTATQAQLDVDVASDLSAQAAVRTARDGLTLAEAQVAQAAATRSIAALNLANVEIRAPVGGLISERAAQVGALAGSGAPLFRIIADAEVELEAEVIETALGDIEAGDPAVLRIAGVGDAAGTVRRVDPIVSRSTRLGIVRVALEGDAARPGLFASGWIETARRDARVVPVSAIQTDAAGDYVLRLGADDVLERAAVEAGLVWEDDREILSGLEVGDVVVARAGAFFAPGDRIEPLAAAEVADAGAEVAVDR